ncbi:MAG: hypothetical protein RQ763_10020 [Sulfurimonas sp.]|uniref:hypothetical protein n=1 Tax=Sulfurimonas sp. TaxID=2022749 RepID=UPI0028CC8744|nr:hypothetical protein [Sulfurimonas sp.]MDT8339527.1 hypothetical protein [Sulfurimonas sp.]
MRLLLLACFFIFSASLANATQSSDTSSYTDSQNINQTTFIAQEEIRSLPKVIYLSYEEVPSRVLKGEIFTVTIKSLSTVKDFMDISYTLSNSEGLKFLSDFPKRKKDSKYFYETFHFLATSQSIRLPDFTATLIGNNDEVYRSTTLLGQKLNVVSLNPKKDFSNIVANSFELLEYKTTSYDNAHNIIVFVAAATNCDISALKLHGAYKQGIESVSESYLDSKITYYAVIDKNLENLSFSYFNLEKNRFIPIYIPIVVDDDSVATQSDLKPKDQSREMLKMAIAGAVAVVASVIILWRKKYIYLLFILFPLTYIIYTGLPSKEVCLKEGSNIYLLPLYNGTIFETAQESYHLQKENEVDGWIKVRLDDEKVGWIKNEDICSR